MPPKPGKIIVAHDVNVWPHEMETARALAAAGYTVEFIRKSEEYRRRSADIVMNGVLWEIKAPVSSTPRAIQRCLHRGLHQAKRLIIDSLRIKKMPDCAVERELRKESMKMRGLKKLLFINHTRNVIDIL